MATMIDSAIAILIGVLLVEMARFGGQVSANPPAHPQEAKRYTWRFRIYATIACLLIIIQAVRSYHAASSANQQQQQLYAQITSLKDQGQKSEAGRQVDNAYLKAKLEDAYKAYDDLRQFAPALMKVAETGAEYSKRQFESKVLNDKQLTEYTDQVIKKTRDLQSQYKAQYDQLNYSQLRTNPPNYQTMTNQQWQEYFASEMNQRMQTEMMLRNQYEQAYRMTIMSDAAYARRELLKRVGGEESLLPMERTKYIAIEGIFAGVDPIGDSADYLSALLHKLNH
jgi:hypothetical protein